MTARTIGYQASIVGGPDGGSQDKLLHFGPASIPSRGQAKPSEAGPKHCETDAKALPEEVREEAADGLSGGLGNRFTGEDSRQGFPEVAPGRGRTFDTERHEPIVDAAVIQKALVAIEHGGLRRDRRSGELDELLLRVAERSGGIGELANVRSNGVRGFGRIRIDHPEPHAARRELLVHALNFGRVPIRDRAIDAREDEHDCLDVGCGFEGIDKVIVEIGDAYRRGDRRDQYEREQPCGTHDPRIAQEHL